MNKYNVIIPVYNEAERVATTCDAILSFLESNLEYTFLFIDDGSTDNTIDIIKNKISQPDKVKVLPLGANLGKGAAVKIGILNTDTEYVCFIDGDLAYSFNHLPVMFKKNEEGCDVVIGSRALGFKNKQRIPIIRRLLGGGFNILVRLMTGLPFRDTQAGLKSFKTDKAKIIFSKIHDPSFWFDVEVLFIAHKYNYSICEVPAIVASHHTEKDTRVNLVKDTLKMFLGLFKIHIYNITGQYKQ